MASGRSRAAICGLSAYQELSGWARRAQVRRIDSGIAANQGREAERHRELTQLLFEATESDDVAAFNSAVSRFESFLL